MSEYPGKWLSGSALMLRDAVLSDPCVRSRVKDWLRESEGADPVDVFNDCQLMMRVCACRLAFVMRLPGVVLYGPESDLGGMLAAHDASVRAKLGGSASPLGDGAVSDLLAERRPFPCDVRRVVVDWHGLAVSPDQAAADYGEVPDYIFQRGDGWSCGAPDSQKLTAHRLWADDWVKAWHWSALSESWCPLAVAGGRVVSFDCSVVRDGS